MPYNQVAIDRAALLKAGLGLAGTSLVPGLLFNTQGATARAGNAVAPVLKARLTVDAWITNGSAAGMESLRAHATQITRINPSWYTLDGDLTIAGRSSAPVMRLARDNDIMPIPFDSRVRWPHFGG